MAEETFAARLRKKAADTKIWSKHLPVICIPPDEANALAEVLEAMFEVVARDPVEESGLDLIYRCRFCGEHAGHAESCPWRQGAAALARLNARVAVKSAEGQPGS